MSKQNLQTRRHALYAQYVKDLEEIKGFPFPDLPSTKFQWCQDYLDQPYYEWIDIVSDDTVVGFLIIGKAPDCHPDCDYFICQSYVSKEYRHHFLMTNTVTNFVNSHTGKYCLMILKTNDYAKQFWFNLFNDLGYEPLSLPIVTEMEHDEIQYGFTPRISYDCVQS